MALVFGHKNPDLDSVVGAIALADLCTKRGFASQPLTQGPITPEADFVLEKFGLIKPQILNKVAGQDVWLVDYSDLAQAPEDIKEANIQGIVDHHKLGDLTTTKPLEMWVWPVGSSNTVLKNLFDFYQIEISRPLAGAMLCAILSDTVLFKSPTATKKDQEAAEVLAEIAGVEDILALGMDLFKVKSAVADASAKDLVFRDYKDFTMQGKKIGIGQIELVDLSLVAELRPQLQAELDKLKAEGRHSVILLLTDILKEGSDLLFASDDPTILEKAFKANFQQSVWLPGVLSRKKQVVPPLEEAFAKSN